MVGKGMKVPCREREGRRSVSAQAQGQACKHPSRSAPSLISPPLSRRMDGWMDGQIDVWMEGRESGRKEGLTD